MLIAQGANDPRVKQAESEQIVQALRAKGKTWITCFTPTKVTVRAARKPHGFLRRR